MKAEGACWAKWDVTEKRAGRAGPRSASVQGLRDERDPCWRLAYTPPLREPVVARPDVKMISATGRSGRSSGKAGGGPAPFAAQNEAQPVQHGRGSAPPGGCRSRSIEAWGCAISSTRGPFGQ